MPIGFDDDAGGGGSPPPAEEAPSDPADPWAHGPEEDGSGEWAEPVAEDQCYWEWVEVTYEETREVVYDVWVSGSRPDCPECGPMIGYVAERGAADANPPLHPNCDCSWSYDHSEYITESTTVWEEHCIPY